ncbi:MAG: hypothetical protein JWO38_8028, partial [Gemmataceae bacterium]|nr:hypothetical protein [Gemmataceae bacterium]
MIGHTSRAADELLAQTLAVGGTILQA